MTTGKKVSIKELNPKVKAKQTDEEGPHMGTEHLIGAVWYISDQHARACVVRVEAVEHRASSR